MPSNSGTTALAPSGFGRRAAGSVAAIAIGVVVAAIFLSIQLTAISGKPGVPVDVAHLVRMTTIQAGLTTIISMIVGIALAWALNRLAFPGRNLVIGLFSAAIVTPGLVVALGLLTVWGRAGWVNAALAPLGIDLGSSIFGLQGILLAHVILDATYAARILIARLDAVPLTRLKTGQSLGLTPWQRFRVIDWPAMNAAVPGISAIVFLLAFTSFPIVLLLGGGPANQTLEVAIYSEVRLNFDLHAAVGLALVQLVICAAVIIPAAAFTPSLAAAGRAGPNPWPERGAVRIGQIVIVLVAFLGFALPLLSVLIDGFGRGLLAAITRPGFEAAAITSLVVGTSSALLTLVLALALSMGRTEMRNPVVRMLVNLPVYAYLVVPAVVLSLGFFIAVRNIGLPPVTVAPYVLVLANSLLALPFSVATLGPALAAIDRRYKKLNRSLGLTGWQRWRLVEWPLLGREIGIVVALGFCYSLGDLGVISLFGTDDFATLPWLMVRAMGAYRTNDAGAIAAVMLVVSLIAFWALPAIFERLSDARD